MTVPLMRTTTFCALCEGTGRVEEAANVWSAPGCPNGWPDFKEITCPECNGEERVEVVLDEGDLDEWAEDLDRAAEHQKVSA